MILPVFFSDLTVYVGTADIYIYVSILKKLSEKIWCNDV